MHLNNYFYGLCRAFKVRSLCDLRQNPLNVIAKPTTDDNNS